MTVSPLLSSAAKEAAEKMGEPQTPDDLLQAHAHAYAGCIIQDMGYYPFGSHFFSDVVHYVRSGDFVRELLGHEVQTRLRPHFFPFTEPSFELDIRMPGIQSGKWMELLGCGMVNPAVFEAINTRRGDNAYDPEEWTGFAFGMGLERLAMSLFGLPDIRLLVENDQRFLAQFAK